ncbi:MAG: 30S ribosomal protein S6 [Puniceicoccales bacterium]|jgi:ribosomal protein S6|nr:30S ribosomal protein S6 [Puniceicoccales bacterium]
MSNRYRITLVFDTREQRESADDMRQRIGKMMESLGASVEASRSLGIFPFARCTSRKFTAGSYAQYELAAKGSFNGEFTAKLRLDKTVNCALIERL